MTYTKSQRLTCPSRSGTSRCGGGSRRCRLCRARRGGCGRCSRLLGGLRGARGGQVRMYACQARALCALLGAPLPVRRCLPPGAVLAWMCQACMLATCAC